MKPRAILFGSIGTLVETSELQRLAFNEAFDQAGLDWDWTSEVYRSLLDRPGGRNRIARFAADRGEWVDTLALHDRKTKLFNQMIIDQGLRARSGVVEIIENAKTEGISIGLASTTSLKNIDAIFNGLNGMITRADFAFVGHRGLVTNVKPAPDIYLDAIDEFGIGPHQAIAIEDTASSLASATAAGLPCIAFPGAYATEQSFENATIVTDHLSWEAIASVEPTSHAVIAPV